ncbi:MAG: ABC transporter ATP-binding protein [Candidatus Cybelea sp.]
MARVVEVAGLQKTYALGDESVKALRGVDLSLEAGEFVAVMGPSGSGKSTFMHIAGLLDTPTAGTYRFEDCEGSTLSPDARADIRGRRLGFVFQAYNLLPRTSAVENVELPMVYAGVPEIDRRRIALEKLETIGIPQLANHHPNQMSGGQQQRVAIARALVNDPGLILADEPTGALDTQSSQDIMRLFTRLNAEEGITIMIVTHEPEVAAYARRIVTFRDGLITSDTLNQRRAA